MRVREIEPFGEKFSPISPVMEEHCYGGVLPHVHFMKVAEGMMNDYADLPKFLYFHTEDNHVPNQIGFSLIDADVSDFLNRISWNDTLLVFLGDHGIGYGSMANTQRGQFEYHNPLMLISMPRRVLDKHSTWGETMRKNQHRLVTFFDLHVTLRNLLRSYLTESKREETEESTSFGWNCPGIDLLNEVVPWSRGCVDAAIPTALCNCAQWTHVPKIKLRASCVRSAVEVVLKAVSEEGIRHSPEQFSKYCFVDSSHAVGNRSVDTIFSPSSFEIASLEFFEDPYESSPVGQVVPFRMTIAGLTSKSPASIKLLFQVVGLAVFDDIVDGFVQQFSLKELQGLKRASRYGLEPCLSQILPSSEQFCVCIESTVF